MHSRSEPEDSDVRGSRSRSRTSSKKKEVKGILKHDREKERYYSSSCDDEEEKEEVIQKCRDSRCLIGRVARPAGYKPGRGGGLSLIVKKNIKNEDKPRVIRPRLYKVAE
ncbi:uncharacterized protein LOC126376742 [Pectinophora gossypiella]|uniref:uncharacterized protein LOC126376742 n=1 Tax=Pectinophora gossypiella TaxID=13191 RepID=UPI00214E298C|nr:uncharacterized protein LOC126376742 [Pectinophora gossypiella]XP_049880265.1 uncharacterized protein LOC126376742 [Pectinophora gossypiella]